MTSTNDQSLERDHLGRGWAFPPTWYRSTTMGHALPKDGHATRSAQVRMSERIEDISEAITIILETNIGERVMQPEFGSDIHRYVFSPITTETKTGLRNAVLKALLLWERRILEVEVAVEECPHQLGRLDIEITYSEETHRMRQSLIYPFYLEQPEIPR